MMKKFLINAAVAVIIGIGVIFLGAGVLLRLASEIEIWAADPWTTGIFLLLVVAAAVAFIKGRIERKA